MAGAQSRRVREEKAEARSVVPSGKFLRRVQAGAGRVSDAILEASLCLEAGSGEAGVGGW